MTVSGDHVNKSIFYAGFVMMPELSGEMI